MIHPSIKMDHVLCIHIEMSSTKLSFMTSFRGFAQRLMHRKIIALYIYSILEYINLFQFGKHKKASISHICRYPIWEHMRKHVFLAVCCNT